ncbi:shikimate dehydrogenase [Peptacetobacter sp.]|uniref:shikimate dehydrogenase n=1 Tax=Peptacetobacter sp. TaxID=2991975 RepID=UPI0026170B69|nr:shikimate dehydrogenase [Peptacetobacter sp.]
MSTNYKTKLFALIGHPISNSFSPIMHSYLFEKYNINGSYLCFDVEPEKIEDVVDNMKNLKVSGFNITIPYKTKIVNLLDKIDRNAEVIGSINTVKNEKGVFKGYNTDGKGFVKSILDHNYDIKNKKALILGCGGACRSIVVELASQGIKTIDIRNRSIDNAIKIKENLNKYFDTEILISQKSIEKYDLEKYDFLINTTPIGMESDECPIDESIRISNDLIVCDIVYKPHRTNLIKWAENNNLKIIYGIDMLINQGIYAFEIWTGKKVDKEDIKILKKIFEDNKI